ncbi:hypothetical protein M3Y99_01838600 [Aphelenchoides fujianensis]|nr:hypothetical protein M3Y99_01838600 [Aphelenchoides fujianensis]
MRSLFVLLVLSSLLSAAAGRKCHLCGELDHGRQFIDCRNPMPTQCEGSCGKEVINGIVSKGCFKHAGREEYRERGCFNDQHTGGWFCTCNSDWCNSAAKPMGVVWSAVAAAAMLLGGRLVVA